jgi:ATP-dependent Clp protease ATP-binding subunit ClpX
MNKAGTTRQPPRITCSFCGKRADQVSKIITGPGVHICNECITMCNSIMQDDAIKNQKQEIVKTQASLPKPKEIKDHLDQYVIGQDDAKMALAVAVYNHYKRVNSSVTDDVLLEKSNILFVGPTGSGKTLLAQTMAKFLNVPFTIADATVLTEAGYVGEDVESILVRLLQAADYNVAQAERGIVFLDEVDKISRRSANPSITRDVSGEGVQQGLLKLLEGTTAAIPPKGGRKHPEQNLVHINTKNILFICGGAFETLDKIIANRINKSSMGFGSEVRSRTHEKVGVLLRQCEPDDLIQFGLIPELVGRVPLIVGLDELDEEALLRILLEPKNALIKQFIRLLELDNVELEFTPDAMQAVVRKAVERKTGARGLRSIMEKSLQKIMYQIPTMENIEKVIFNAQAIRGEQEPILVQKAVKSGSRSKAG